MKLAIIAEKNTLPALNLAGYVIFFFEMPLPSWIIKTSILLFK